MSYPPPPPPPPGPNPYSSPAFTLPDAGFPTGSSQSKMEYMRSINYVFENPNWLVNALMSFLCQIVAGMIPIVPQMVLFGYQFEVIDNLLESRGTRYTDFNLNRIGDYLGRGVWPFLAMFVVSIAWAVVAILFALIFVGCIAATAEMGGQDAGPILATLGILLAVVFGLVLIVLMMLLVTPVALRGGLTQDFGASFDFAWINDFVRKMWVEVLLSTLFLVFASIVAIVCTCGLGYFIVVPLVPFVQAHFWYQFYVLYLARGGMPIPTKKAAMPENVITPPTY